VEGIYSGALNVSLNLCICLEMELFTKGMRNAKVVESAFIVVWSANNLTLNMRKYTNYAQSLASTSDFKDKNKLSGFLSDLNQNNPDLEAQISALLDYLEENGEDIVVPTNRGNLKLNFPTGAYHWSGKTKTDLVKKIMNDPIALNYLRKLYT
jgi:hypothetical protein